MARVRHEPIHPSRMQDFGDASGAATHMNIDHADSLLAFAHHYLPREMGVNRAEMTDATPDGIHLRVFTKSDNGEGEKVLIPYPAGHNVSHARCLRKVTVAMHADALEGLGRLYRLRFYARKRPSRQEHDVPRQPESPTKVQATARSAPPRRPPAS